MKKNSISTYYKNLSAPIKASFWFLICSVLQKGISFITTPIFTRLMDTSEYGAYSVFMSWESIISIFITLNLSHGVYAQGLVKYEDDRKRYSSSLQGLTFLLIVIWTIVYLIFRGFFNNIFSLNTTYMLLMIISIWISSVFNFWASEQRVEYKYKHLVIITLIASIMSPIAGIIFIHFMQDNVLARILGLVTTYALTYTWMFISQIWRGKKLYLKKYWKHALNFNIPLIPHYLSQTILASSDRIMINEMINSSTAGIYSLAYSLSMIMTIVNNALMQTISPWIYKKIKAQQIKDIANIAYPSLVLIAIVNIILIAFAPEAVRIFAPSEYYDAIWIISPIAMSVFFMFAYDLFAKFEFYFEKTKLIATATVIGATLNIVLNYIFIKIFGYYAAGYTTLLCYMLYSLFHFIAMRKVCKDKCNNVQPYQTKVLLKIAITFLCLGFIFLILYKSMIVRYLFIFILLMVLFVYRNNIKKQLNNICSVRQNVN